MTTRIEQLKAMPIHGNAYHDMPIFNLAHRIIMDPCEPMETKIEAIKKIDEAQGTTGEEEVTELAVQEYIDSF